MTPDEAVKEIRECLDDNLSIDNLCVRVLLRAYERLREGLQRIADRDTSGRLSTCSMAREILQAEEGEG